jgi:hypothetical protein
MLNRQETVTIRNHPVVRRNHPMEAIIKLSAREMSIATGTRARCISGGRSGRWQ